MLKREDYKAIKHMNRENMSAYLQKIYRRGFEAGIKASKTAALTPTPAPDF